MTTDTRTISISIILHKEVFFLSYDSVNMKASARFFNGRPISEKKLFPLFRVIRLNYPLNIDWKYWEQDIHLLGEQIIKELNKIICN